MYSSSCIEQKGVIEEIANGLAKVRISSFTACADCHAKTLCGIPGDTTRYIEVPVKDNDFFIGEPVYIGIKRTLGLKASLLAYLVPFILMLLMLIMLLSFQVNELISGMITLLILLFYFIGLYFFRDRMSKAFTFILQKT